MPEIELGDIREGDWVRVKDCDGNVVETLAYFDGFDRDKLYVRVFGTRVYIARRTKAGWQRQSGNTVVAHQPKLFT